MAESRLRRWSKRKAESSQEQEKFARQEAVKPKPAEEPESKVEEEQPETEAKEIELPPLESLGPESDYSVFMLEGVDDQIKKLALRKLFKSPFFNVLDGLNDYDEDFTNFEPLGDIITSDMKFHQERKKAEQEQKEREELQKRIEEEEIQTLAKEEGESETTVTNETEKTTEAIIEDSDQDSDTSVA